MSGVCPVSAANASDPALVHTAAGLLRGIAGEKYRMWLGVPFAEPPLDDLRWMPPRAKRTWAPQTLEAFDKKDNCAQSSVYGGWEPASPDDPHGSAEDCLYMVSSSQVLMYGVCRRLDTWCWRCCWVEYLGASNTTFTKDALPGAVLHRRRGL